MGQERENFGFVSFGRCSLILMYLLDVLISCLLFYIFISFDIEMGVFVFLEMVGERKDFSEPFSYFSGKPNYRALKFIVLSQVVLICFS